MESVRDLDSVTLAPLYLSGPPELARVVESMGPRVVVEAGVARLVPRISDESRFQRRIADLPPEKRTTWERVAAFEQSFRAASSLTIRALRNEPL